MQKLKVMALENKQEIWEMIRYIVAGALTTLVSLIVSYGLYFLMAVGPAAETLVFQEEPGAVRWVIAVINSATTLHVTIGNVSAWIVAVVFAFWINRWMVFRVRYDSWEPRLKAFMQFISARVISLLLFELGLAALLSMAGITNLIGRIMVLVVVMVFNYIASKFWIFKPKEAPETKP